MKPLNPRERATESAREPRGKGRRANVSRDRKASTEESSSHASIGRTSPRGEMRPMAAARDASHSAGFSARTGAQCPQSGHLCFEDAVSAACERGSGDGGAVSRKSVRRRVCRCSECQAVVLGDLADFLGGELGGVCDDPERYAALEQFQRDFFHGIALATCLTACLTACLTVFHCDF
mgnify:CR=1 FL=1